jgi:hypothetical protein
VQVRIAGTRARVLFLRQRDVEQLRFRYYDPVSLRWTGADPLYRFVPDIGLSEPQRLNLYSFSLASDRLRRRERACPIPWIWP